VVLMFVGFVFTVRLRRKVDALPAKLTYAARREERYSACR
jgi:hypothetical protein